ncbi:MAG TPA: protein BatD [bacterium (Candidatus Stahlbacteria)]|nr:protein BatD [Candidatus Stahlbacteria bacterium]
MRKIVPILLLLLPFSTLFGEQISFNASCDKSQVPINESFTLEVTVSGDITSVPKPTLPPLNDFEIYSTGQTQNISIINGRVSSSITFTYTLYPKRLGTFTIGSCELHYKGKSYKTQPIKIEVVKASTPVSPAAPKLPKKSRAQKPSTKREAKDLFITTSVNKRKVYVGEQIILTFKFYQGVNLLSNPQYTPPTTEGFWTEDLGKRTTYAVIEGRQYNVTEIRYALFPIAAGKYTIGAATLVCQIDDFFSRPFSFSLGGEREVLRSNPIPITVLPLPENQPKSFTGAVGKFSFSASIDKNSTKQNEPITLALTVAGTGNIKSVKKPPIPSMQNFKVYESGSKLELTNTNAGVQGKKIFNIILVPQAAGKYTIPACEFSYFEPTSKKYITLRSAPVSVQVTPAATGEIATTAIQQNIELLGSDIKYIKTGINLKGAAPYVYTNKLFLILQVLPIFVFLICLRYATRRERLTKDIGYARAIRAQKIAYKRLKECAKLKQSGAVKEFYGSLSKALTEYVSDKLNIKAPSLTMEAISDYLVNKGIAEDIIKKMGNILQICDFARFASGKLGHEDMEKSYKEAIQIIGELENKLK